MLLSLDVTTTMVLSSSPARSSAPMRGGNLQVEPLDFEEVVEQIGAHLRRVRKEPGNRDPVGAQARLRAGASFVRAMGIVAAEPEGKRLAGSALRQEFVELLELRSGRIARAPAWLDLTGPPALSHEADVIAGSFEDVRIHGESLGEEIRAGCRPQQGDAPPDR